MEGPNNDFDADFASFESFSSSDNVEEINNSEDNWSADFQSFEESIKIEETICNPSILLKGLCEECFIEQSENVQKVTKTIQDRYKSSLLSGSLQSQILDPIEPKTMTSYQLILGQMQVLLDLNKIKANWLINVSEASVGTFRNNFDFHVLCKKKENSRKSTQNRTEKPTDLSNLYQNNGFVDTNLQNKPHINESVNDGKIQQKQQNGHVKLSYNNTAVVTVESVTGNDSCPSMDFISNSSLPDLEFSLKTSFEELSLKPVKELESLAIELEIQAKIYSELLLSELDNRDELQRQQEIMNNFISSHVAVERKLSQDKQKQKSRYGFFKFPDENKTGELTIPYFSQDEDRPTIAELSLITEILKAIEKEDPDAPKLISDYVFKLGNRFDLDTVIKVRTSTGVTPVESH